MSTESPISLAAVHTMRALARAFGHGWAIDPDGPSDEEVIEAYEPEDPPARFSRATTLWWRRLQAADAAEQDRLLAEAVADPARYEYLASHPVSYRFEWAGLGPDLAHESGSGTVTWTVDPRSGAVVVIFQRAVGPATIPGYGGPFRQRVEVARISHGTLRVFPDPRLWADSGEARPADHVWACVQRACVALGMTRPADGAWPQRAPRKPLPGADLPQVRRL